VGGFEFVKKFTNKTIKTSYNNRQKINDIKNTLQTDGGHFNELFVDQGNTSVADDLKRKYVGMKLVVASELLKIIGLKKWNSKKSIKKATIIKNLEKHKKKLAQKMTGICDIFGREKRNRPDTDKWVFRGQMDFVNSILMETLQIKIKQTVKYSGIYKIDGLDLYNFD